MKTRILLAILLSTTSIWAIDDYNERREFMKNGRQHAKNTKLYNDILNSKILDDVLAVQDTKKEKEDLSESSSEEDMPNPLDLVPTPPVNNPILPVGNNYTINYNIITYQKLKNSRGKVQVISSPPQR